MLRQRLLWSALALTLAYLPASAQTTPTPTPVPLPPARPANAVAATVNGQPILEGAVQRGLERVPPASQAEARPELLNSLIDNALLDQYLLQFQVKVEQAEVDKKLEEIKAEVKKARKIEFDKFLAEMKLTEAELRVHVLSDLRWEKFASAQATDKALADLFNGNKDIFDGSMVRARHILLTPGNDPKAIEAAIAQLRTARQEIESQVASRLQKTYPDAAAQEKDRCRLIEEVFAAKAKEISACPSGKSAGGDVNWFGRMGDMVEPFARTAFALKPYQMSDVVKTQFGCHLILAVDRRPGRDVKFEAVKEVVKAVYGDKLREAIVDQQRPKAKIEIVPAKP